MNYKIAGHTMGTPEYTVLEALELFKKIGLDGAEIVVQDDYKSGLPTECTQEQLDEVKKKAEELGIRIIALTPYNSKFNSLDEEIRHQEMNSLRKVIGYAQYLGAEYIRIYAGNYAGNETDPDDNKWAKLIESMKELGDDAQKAGVTLVMENHFNTMTVSAKQSMDAAIAIDHPAVGILYDQANLTFTLQEDYETALEIQSSKVRYVHTKDLEFKAGNTAFVSDEVSHPKEEDRNVYTRIIGEGTVPWPQILKLLRDKGYEGWLSMEYERRWHPDDIPDASIGMKQGAEYLRKVMAEIAD